MHILLTRPLEDCSELALKFQSLGHKISHLPLLNIEKINYDKIDFSEFGGIIFTSANAVKYLDLKDIDKKVKCFCVGNVTEKKARDLGFQNTVAAEGNVSNLKELILRTYDTKNKKLINVSGETFIIKLRENIPDIVYVYSQNSASSFLNFIKIYQTETLWMNTNLMCIGEKTSSILNEIKWKKIFLFNPGEEEFLLYKI